jgi:hypothetical protein
LEVFVYFVSKNFCVLSAVVAVSLGANAYGGDSSGFGKGAIFENNAMDQIAPDMNKYTYSLNNPKVTHAPKIAISPGELSNDIHKCFPSAGGPGYVQPDYLAPYADEVNQWAATRLTPDGFPFFVTDVSYYAGEGQGSFGPYYDPTLAHGVKIYVGSDLEPPKDATPEIEFEVDIDESMPAYNLIQLSLDQPIRLDEGEHLFVAIESAGSYADSVVAVLSCRQTSGLTTTYWSYTVSQPWNWGAVEDLDLMVWAAGYGWIQ